MGDTRWERNISVVSGPEEALPEPAGAQSSEDTSQEASAVGLDVGECEKRAGELLGVRQSLTAALRLAARVSHTGFLCPWVFFLKIWM